ncbi:MAG: DUF547 domain-containing protein [Chloroflexota bacterium]|nr:MAG: DUF547 domain-containing protein [Chloroflexota bacterium]
MSFLDTYVTGREKILNSVLQVNPETTLNSRGSPPKRFSGGNFLAGEIKDSLNLIISLALDENGKVDYQKLVRDPHYDTYRKLVVGLQDFDYQTLTSREERMSFWINLYNSLVIDAVIRENIQKSVIESRLGILAFFQKAAYWINYLRFSLTDIEHGVLRENHGFPYFPGPHFASTDPRLETIIQSFDPRIHFALNCASNSCPPIAVYTPEKLDEQLDLAALNFINNDLSVNLDRKVITISRIFSWYQNDFGRKKGVISLLERYIQEKNIKLWLSENQTSIRIQYHPYDWGLNKFTN